MIKKKCLSIFIVCVIVILSSCDKSNRGESNLYINDGLLNDNELLETGLTTSYKLSELRVFFEGSNLNESVEFKTNTKMLKYTDVNERFPIQVLRTRGYSVYRVEEGGLFYVFWVSPVSTNATFSEEKLTVYFTAYLTSNMSIDHFDRITPGISTAKDVKAIDPYMELSFLISNGIFSYSFINEETLLEIEFVSIDPLDEYGDLIVKEKKVVSRESVQSQYSLILSSDMP